MNTKYQELLLLFRGPCWDEGLSDDQAQIVMNKVMAWFQDLEQRGIVKGGEALAREGRTISGKQGRGVADGPFVESKEAIGGYLLLQGVSFEEAVAIAKSNPTLELGISIEIRPLLAECPTFKRIRERLQSAAIA